MKVDQNLVQSVHDLKVEYLCNSADALRAIKENEKIRLIADSLHAAGLPPLTKSQIGLLVSEFSRMIRDVITDSLYHQSTAEKPLVDIDVNIAALTKPTAHKERQKSIRHTSTLHTPDILPNYEMFVLLYSRYAADHGFECGPELAAVRDFCDSNSAFSLQGEEGTFSLKELVTHLQTMNNVPRQIEQMGYELDYFVNQKMVTEDWLSTASVEEKHAFIIKEKLENHSAREYTFEISSKPHDISQHPEFRHLQKWRDIYATAENEMTLGVLHIERMIALAYVIGAASVEDSFNSAESTVAAINNAHTYAKKKIKQYSERIDKYTRQHSPQVLIDNTTKSLEREKYVAKIVLENKKWLTDVLSR